MFLSGIRSGWDRHVNGGGLVQSTAFVGKNVYLGRDSCVKGNASVIGCVYIYGNVSIGENAFIGGDTFIYGNVRIGGSASISGDISITGNTYVGGRVSIRGNVVIAGFACAEGDAYLTEHAYVTDDAYIGGDAWIRGDSIIRENTRIVNRVVVRSGTWNITPLYIAGSKYDVYITAPNIIKIGCIEYPISKWLENYKEIGRENNFTDKEIKEYGEYIQSIWINRDLLSVRGL